VIERMARLGGFEPPTSGSGDQRQNAMLMILLAQSCTLDHGFVPYSALNGPKSDPSFCSAVRKKISLTYLFAIRAQMDHSSSLMGFAL